MEKINFRLLLFFLAKCSQMKGEVSIKNIRISLIVALLLTCTFIFELSVRAYDDYESCKMNGEVYEKGTWNIGSRELVMEKEALPFSALICSITFSFLRNTDRILAKSFSI